MNYYRRFMGDYAKKTAALSLAEHGAYTLLLDELYSTETPLPAEHEALYRLCRAMTKVEQDAVRAVADRFFPVEADGLRHNQRADEEIAKAQATIAKQRESGAEAARKRWSTDGSTHSEPTGSTDWSTDQLTSGLQIQPPTSNSNHQPQGKNNVGLAPDDSPPKPDFRKQAASVIAALNQRTGRNYGLNGANADHVVARLKDGASVDLCLAVIDLKAKEWSGDTAMAKYLRPETLFNRTKFATYSGEIGSRPVVADRKAVM